MLQRARVIGPTRRRDGDDQHSLSGAKRTSQDLLFAYACRELPAAFESKFKMLRHTTQHSFSVVEWALVHQESFDEAPRVHCATRQRGGISGYGMGAGSKTDASIVMETMWVDTVDKLRGLAAEFVRRNVNVIFAPSSTEVEAARQATRTIPIVFSFHADPVGVGHVASLPRPGGNITGLTMLLTDLSAKELEILKDAMPQAERIGVLWNPTTPSHAPALKAIEAGAEKLRVRLRLVPARTRDDLPAAFAAMVDERADALLVVSSPLARVERSFLAELELEHRLPAMFGSRWNVEAGGLMSYAADLDDLTRRAAVYIDKILKGTKPADLPVEQASKYQLAVNLKTAKALGLTLPESFLVRADEVIE
jgi:putative tryptophan/tyrosine transport system substrate-binding protein